MCSSLRFERGELDSRPFLAHSDLVSGELGNGQIPASILELSWNSMGLLCPELVPYDFSLGILRTISLISSHEWCMLGCIVWIWMKSILFGSLRANLISASLDMPKWVWPSWTDIGCSFLKPPHYLQARTANLLSMEGVLCKTTNSRPKVMLSYRMTLRWACFSLQRNWISIFGCWECVCFHHWSVFLLLFVCQYADLENFNHPILIGIGDGGLHHARHHKASGPHAFEKG